MPVYDANNKLLGVTYEGSMYIPGRGKVVLMYVTYLAEGYFDGR